MESCTLRCGRSNHLKSAVQRQQQLVVVTSSPSQHRYVPKVPSSRCFARACIAPARCLSLAVRRVRVQDVGAVRRAYTEANMEAEIQGQKLTEVITKLKGDLKTVAEVSTNQWDLASACAVLDLMVAVYLCVTPCSETPGFCAK